MQWSNKRKDLYIFIFVSNTRTNLISTWTLLLTYLTHQTKMWSRLLVENHFLNQTLLGHPILFLDILPFSLFLFVFMLDLCVHSAIDIFNFRVDFFKEFCPKAGLSTYKCGHKQQFLIFFKREKFTKTSHGHSWWLAFGEAFCEEPRCQKLWKAEDSCLF